MEDNIQTIPLQITNSITNAITVFTAEKENAPVVIILPALGTKAAYYRHYAKELSAQGINAITVDHRGHGNSSVRPNRKNNFGYKEQVEEEYLTVLKKVKALFPRSRVIVMGHSIGGQMGCLLVSRYRHLVNGFILNASCTVYYKGWGKVNGIGILLFAALCNAAAKLLGYYPGNFFRFGGVEARGIMEDWYTTAASGKLNARGSGFDYEKAIREAQLPILAINYFGDASAPYSALKCLCDKFQSATVSIHQVKHAQPGKKYNHYSWIREPEIAIGLVCDWIKRL
jgi:predicted alpha/beta hydrolase